MVVLVAVDDTESKEEPVVNADEVNLEAKHDVCDEEIAIEQRAGVVADDEDAVTTSNNVNVENDNNTGDFFQYIVGMG